MTFVQDVLDGKATFDQIDDYIDYWHADQTVDEPLSTFLGFSEEEYSEYCEKPLALQAIIKNRALHE